MPVLACLQHFDLGRYSRAPAEGESRPSPRMPVSIILTQRAMVAQPAAGA